MHRKIVVVDAPVAFVGGINYSADHLADFGPEAKQDYAGGNPRAAGVRDPPASATRAAEGQRHSRDKREWWRLRRQWRTSPADLPTGGPGRRDVRHARQRPAHGRHRALLPHRHPLGQEAHRHRQRLLLSRLPPHPRTAQGGAARRGRAADPAGEPDMAFVKTAAEMLYHHLLRSGVRIYEYCARPLHGKVALMDDDWATVGSSNLDPLSLALNLEANVVIRDARFAACCASACST
jgi:cardiolipin synthase